MTEKIWRTLIVGSVPVYFGAPNIKVGIQFMIASFRLSPKSTYSFRWHTFSAMVAKQQVSHPNR